MSVMTWFSILEQSVRALRRVHFSLIFIDELALIEELLCFFLILFAYQIIPWNCVEARELSAVC